MSQRRRSFGLIGYPNKVFSMIGNKKYDKFIRLVNTLDPA
jgi:hypothetical protein